LFQRDIALSILHVFEAAYPGDNGPKKALEAVQLWFEGKITYQGLEAHASPTADYPATFDGSHHAATAAFLAARPKYIDSAYNIADKAATLVNPADKWHEIELLFISNFKVSTTTQETT